MSANAMFAILISMKIFEILHCLWKKQELQYFTDFSDHAN